MDFTLREYQDADFDVLWQIDQECFSPGISYTRAELSSHMRARGSLTLVAVTRPMRGKVAEESRILGFILAHIISGGTGHIITIDVLPKGRRRGIGSALLDAAEQRLREGGCVRIRLEAAVDNLSALAFYKRHRYEEIKKIPGYYSNGVDALLLEKRLA